MNNSKNKIIELAEIESKRKYYFSWQPEMRESAFLDGVKFCLKYFKNNLKNS